MMVSREGIPLALPTCRRRELSSDARARPPGGRVRTPREPSLGYARL